ncbi:MAG TPA: hypothetical protein VKZ58_10215 [Longimicrobiales bacterium]|nr:hypothetical protein [Longimicrobiales bacterium]
MNAPALVRSPAQPAHQPPTLPSPGGNRRRPSYRRALAVGLGVSLVINIIAIILAGRWLYTERPPAPVGRAPGAADRPLQGMRVYQLAEGAPPLEEEAERPEERQVDPRVTTPPQAGPGAAGGAGGEVEQGPPTVVPRAVDRIRTPLRDERLWAMPSDRPPPLKSEEELMLERVYGKLGQLNDSLMAEAEARRRATDWTIKGEDGKRWGISPAGLHLGGITVPLPALGLPSSREDARNRLREWGEIQDQADRARVRDRFDERAKAIRERRDREREAQRKPPPDGSQ